jgi:RNA polymerase sigma factor (sigma-70 family)
VKNTLANILIKTKSSKTEEDWSADKREQVLAERVHDDRDAFLALYEIYFRRVYQFALYRCQDTAAAEDLTSTIFQAALERVQHYDHRRAPFGAWLFGIARNIASRQFRASQRRTAPLEAIEDGLQEAAPTPERQVLQREQSAKLLALLEGLNEREQDIISLKFGAQLTNRMIASMAGVSESSVGVTVYRALRKLRRGMEQE